MKIEKIKSLKSQGWYWIHLSKPTKLPANVKPIKPESYIIVLWNDRLNDRTVIRDLTKKEFLQSSKILGFSVSKGFRIKKTKGV